MLVFLQRLSGESGSYLSNPLGLWGDPNMSIKILVVFNPSVLVPLWKVLTVSCPQSFSGEGEITVLWTHVAVVNWPTLAHRSLKYTSTAEVCLLLSREFFGLCFFKWYQLNSTVCNNFKSIFISTLSILSKERDRCLSKNSEIESRFYGVPHTQKSYEQKFSYKDKIYLELPSLSWTVPSLSGFPHRSDMSKAFHHLPGPLVDWVQHIHVSLFSEHWAQHFGCVGAEKRAGITCLDLLVVLCQMQLQRLFASLP